MFIHKKIYFYFYLRVHFYCQVVCKGECYEQPGGMVFRMLLQDETGYLHAEGVEGNVYEKIKVKWFVLFFNEQL